ncbi:cytochrome c oxidase assembly factor 6 homolog isoform X3 [Choloepus didactylus]|uniref:cytochrome c oxidase assembly factor 6 homolog isoform X3 n=1 Tax=Choloepus didactylus TaxID=27675 RepID=UPI00189FA025|nr:cytochrome c oxidase assembly factor 6 homolog isoform X3 [Choloepus didactylus]
MVKQAQLEPTGMAAPSMKERQVCWGARDEYWKCLDENTEDSSQCKKLRSSFESSCPQQWIGIRCRSNHKSEQQRTKMVM